MTLQRIAMLLVEDSPADARLLRAAVSQAANARFDVVVVPRLSEALSRLAEPFDVVLVDLGLPDSQGLDTFRQIRGRAPDAPIVVLTGLSDEAIALQAMQEGAQDYLTKGNVLDGALVVRAIRYAIERHRLGAELVENVAKRREAEEELRKSQTNHLWQSLYRLLGTGASAVLYQAGADAAPREYEYIRRTWKPSGEGEIVAALRDHLRSAGLCDLGELNIDRATSRVTVLLRNSFESGTVGRNAPQPVCHFLRGLLCGVVTQLIGAKELVCDESACEGQGRDHCEFLIHPMFG